MTIILALILLCLLLVVMWYVRVVVKCLERFFLLMNQQVCLIKRKWRLLRIIPSAGSGACKLQLVPWVWGKREPQATRHDLVQIICIKMGMGTWAIVQWGEEGQSGRSPRDSCRSQWRMRRPQNKCQHWSGCIDCEAIKAHGFLSWDTSLEAPSFSCHHVEQHGSQLCYGKPGDKLVREIFSDCVIVMYVMSQVRCCQFTRAVLCKGASVPAMKVLDGWSVSGSWMVRQKSFPNSCLKNRNSHNITSPWIIKLYWCCIYFCCCCVVITWLWTTWCEKFYF